MFTQEKSPWHSPDPAGQSGLLIVEEDAAIPDGGRLLHLGLRHHIDLIAGADWDVSPVVPRADANLLADIVDTVDGTARVAAGDDESARSTLDGVFDNLAGERLPLALDLADVDGAILDELVNDLRVADGADDDEGAGGVGVGVLRAGEGLFRGSGVLV